MRIPSLLFVTLILALFSGPPSYTQVHAKTLKVTAVVVSKGKCSIENNKAGLNFGTLNPLSPKKITTSTEEGMLSFSCVGNGQNDITYSISVTGSVYGTADEPVMRLEGGTFNMPYELRLDPASDTIPNINGPPTSIPLVVTGTVQSDAYILAPVGTYNDVATLTITP